MTSALPNLSQESVWREHEPLATKTTMRVGGAARFYCEPATEDDLGSILMWTKELGLDWFVLGRGANVIVPDEGYSGLIIRLTHPHWRQIFMLDDSSLYCASGVRLQQLSAEACRLGWSGFEFLEGIPGTLGGALRMNAGAMGGWMLDRVLSVRLMSPDGSVTELQRSQLQGNYRSCPELKGVIALSALLAPAQLENPDCIRARIQEFTQRRKSSQPREASAGCLFKNPEGDHAGRLIDNAGLKGLQCGQASVSGVHANFVVNAGSATSAELIELIRKIRQEVFASTGKWLEPEALLLGKNWEDVL
ncbi:MAG: UDP-N-acetylmuramate dehydrogenase [Verrucomicrobia bacterium]|nr:UDP-N-acetylmuramate dehydrogenase [Verrucomicrobiota bacterium]